MNRFTATVWDVIAEDDTLLAELGALMRKQYPPFLSQEQAIKANTDSNTVWQKRTAPDRNFRWWK